MIIACVLYILKGIKMLRHLLPRFLMLSVIALIFKSASALASPTFIDLAEVGVKYSPAQAITELELSFPSSAQNTEQDSLVEARFDIDEQGKPFNYHFARTSGTDIFETLLAKNLDNWVLQPAMHNGKPIIQRNKTYSALYRTLHASGRNPAPEMRRHFQRYYNYVRDLFDRGEYADFEVHMSNLDKANIANFIESRQLFLLKNAYLNKTNGSIHDKIYTLEKALKGEQRTEKGEKLMLKIKARLMALYADNNQLSEARLLYYQIANSEYGKQLTVKLGSSLDEIESKLVAGGAITTQAMVFDTELLNHSLSRHSFSLNANSRLEHMELSCNGFKLSFDYVAGATYTTPTDWGFCVLTVQAPARTIISINEA